MRTRKLMVSLVVCCLCLVQFVNCQEESSYERSRPSILLAKHRGKTYGGQYDPEFIERMRELDSEQEKHNYPVRIEDKYVQSSGYFGQEDGSSLAYRNKRAIDEPGPSATSPGKSGPRGTNSPEQNEKSSQSGREKHPPKVHNDTNVDGICDSIDIRNNLVGFNMLKDCRVIEGFLHIVLLHNTTEKDFQNMSFPKLREITDYFLVYRVAELKSLNSLFPNLEVIRGDTLLTDYSLMIYEMQHLQEIGLNKLTKIMRGGARIELNPSLCYVSTVDWKSIVVAGENFIKDNKGQGRKDHKATDPCPGCLSCPGGHCWSAKHCQKSEKQKCHEQCLGECSGTGDTDCYVCKNYRHKGRCVEKCPPDLYAYLSRRCITKEICQNMVKKSSNSEEKKNFKAFNGSCITKCPNGYEEIGSTAKEKTCRPCEGRCRTVLQGATIRHISDAQRYRGTTVVEGALEFQLRNVNPNLMNELTEAFGMIEEITEYLKVTHSFPVTNLSFFKKLRVIRGKKFDINNASLVVLDNPNLSDLFPEDQQLEILRGRLFFHYNPKLCFSKIVQLGKMVGITNFTDVEVQSESNGEKVACDIDNINVYVHENDLGSNYAKVEWDIYRPVAGQNLLSYLLHYLETDNDVVSFEGNSCGNNNTWQIIDVEITKSSDRMVSRVLLDLKPYTKYAVYVKTLLARANNSLASLTGQSKIIYFRTRSDVPSVPTDLMSFAVSDTEIVVKWGRPEHPNGPIGYYLLSGFIRFDDEKLLSSRNYCTHGLVSETVSEQIAEVTELVPATDLPTATEITELAGKTLSKDNNDCCRKGTDSEAAAPKKFEIFCHDNMAISHLSLGRQNYCHFHRYNVAQQDFYGLSDNLSSPRASTKDSALNDARIELIDDTRTRMWNDTYYSFVFNVSMNSSSYLLNKLRHYSLYTISVAACGQKLANGMQMCSAIQYTSTRTKNRPSADDVRKVNVHVLNDTMVRITWEVARDPNSLTVAHTIEYTNIIVKDAKKSTVCVPQTLSRHKRAIHDIKNLSPGKYSVRVRSMSLAGFGAFSETVSFSIGMKEDNTVVLVVLLTFGFILTVLVVSYIVYRNHQKKKQQERLIASVNPDYIETKYIRDSWEVSRENIELLEELGLGNFGMVYRGILEGTTQVAVKTIAENSGEREKNEFLNEASVMKNFSTFHIIRLLGVVSEGTPPYVIMELMENGDLKTYLRRIRDTHLVPDISRVIRMAGEIADGMSYLESKKFVHRDLAARNCMVTKDLVCKIGDFGMARDIYETDYYKIGKKGLLPIRWMAPENLSDGVFTSDSDVWSYGVVLYEILTLAEIPYQGFSNEEVLNYVLRKGTVNIPRNCPEVILKIMDKCFKWRPSDRPTFMELVAELEPFISQDFCEMSFYHSEEGVEIRNLGLKKVYHHAAPIRFHWGNETARWVREFEDNVTLLDQTKAGTSRGRIFKNGFQHFGNIATMEDVPLDR